MWSKIVNLIVCIYIFGLVGIVLHEWGHFAMAWLLGVSGYVTYPHLVDGLFWPTSPLPALGWLIYPAGGLVSGGILFILWIFGTRVGRPWDMDDQASLYIIMLIEVFYGLAEMTYPLEASPYPWLAPVMVGLACIIGGLVYVPRLMDWWSEK